MKKKMLAALTTVLVLAAGLGAIASFQISKNLGATKAVDVKHSSETCVATTDNPKIAADQQEQSYIANAAITQITDIPAGTHVDVYLKTYDGGTATGTSIYDGKYGSYNFTAKKTGTKEGNSYTGNWQITAFKTCKP